MKHALLTPLLICWLAGSTIWAHPGQEPAVSGDSLYVVYLLSVVAPQPDVAHYVNAFAHLLTGTPYTAGTLDRDTVERLQPGLQETDCTIFVETVLALARCAVQGGKRVGILLPATDRPPLPQRPPGRICLAPALFQRLDCR